MKRTAFLLIMLLSIAFLPAPFLIPGNTQDGLEITYKGVYRTRAFLNNDFDEKDGGWIDNCLRFDLMGKLAKNLGVTWTTEIGNYVWGKKGGFSDTLKVLMKTRELYLDYMFGPYDASLRVGQQFMSDHRSLILDEYLSGLIVNFTYSDIPFQVGYSKLWEGKEDMKDDADLIFADVNFEVPVKWGLMGMFGKWRDECVKDIWINPYFLLEISPVNLDLTAMINHQMFKDNLNNEESETGIGLAAKASAEAGIKLGADFLFVTEEGINSIAPFYENGLYIFGNKLPFEGINIGWGNTEPYNKQETFVSIAGTAAFELDDKISVFGGLGMIKRKEPIGREFNLGMNYKIMKNFSLCTVGAVGKSGKAIDVKTNQVYMVGSILTAYF